MKNLIICLFFACLFITGQATAASMQQSKIKSTTLTEKKSEFFTTKITNEKEVLAIIADFKQKKINENVSFQVCFIHIDNVYLSEAMNGDLYVTIEGHVNCYGVPGQDDMVFVIDHTQQPS